MAALVAATAPGAGAAQLRRSAFLSAGRAGDRTIDALQVLGEPVTGVSTRQGTKLWHGFVGPLGSPATNVASATTAAFALASPAPNPCTSSVAIRFQAARGHAVTLSVYDPRGRRVRRLTPGPLQGDGAVIWRLDRDDGRRVAAGLYFIRIEADGVRLARSVVVLP